MTPAQVAAKVLIGFSQRGFPLEAVKEPTEIICRAVLSMPEEAHERFVNLALDLWSQKL